MKLTAVLLTIAFLQVNANGFSQSITFSGKEVPLEKVFSAIKKQTDYSFFYYTDQLQVAKKVTINVKEATIEEVLNICIKDQPFEYSIKGKTIFIINKQQKETYSIQKEHENGTEPLDVKGRITNAAGEPLSGANIVVKRTGKGTQANANGEFLLKGVDANELLTITYTGYAAQTVRVSGTTLLLVLKLAENELDEMVVQGYGTTTRRLATGNIAKVTAAEIARQPVMNPLLALQGKVAGLDVTQLNGYASATIKVELRGRSAINNGFTSDPLYIVDGVPLTVLDITNNSNYQSGSRGFLQSGNPGPAGGQSPFFSINPADIESIEILKDADATAIYGSRAANGVILITTKKGKSGKTKFDLNIQQGISRVTRFYDLMNTRQYLEMRKEALKNDGITPSLARGDYDLLQWDTTRFTDWQRELYGGTGKTFNVQAGFSGGNAQTSFRIGTGYTRATNILTVSGADQRSSLSFNLSHASLNQKLNVSLSAGYSYTQSDLVGFPAAALTIPPNAPPIYDSAGNLNYDAWGGYGTTARNAFRFGSLKQPYASKTNFLNSNVSISYQPFKGLSISTSLGMNTAQADQESFNPIASQDPLSKPTGSSIYNFNTNKNWIIEPQIAYNLIIGKGKINAQVGGSLQRTTTVGSNITGSGFTSDIILKNIASAASKSAGYFYGEYKYAAVFGRVTYNYENKYILNIALRRDGSSRFGDRKQFGNFGSAGVAWIFTEEKWFKNRLKFLSFGKLRGSYGTTGSDGIGDYGYLTRWSADGTQPYNGVSSLIPIQHANPIFHWQVNKKLEGAIDLGFLKDRILINLAYYRNRCGNQLIDFPIPIYTGFNTVVANSPALVQNDGFEFSGTAKIINSKNLTWSVSFNTGINRNKLIAYPNFELSPYTSTYVVGQSLNVSRLLHYTGVNPLTGLYSFQDKNHDGQISLNNGIIPNDTYNQNLSPKFLGGLGMNFTYRGFNLNMFFNIKKQIGKNAFFNTASNAGSINNQPAEIFGKQWQKPGDNAVYSKFTTLTAVPNLFFRQRSDGSFTDASFVRLSNLSLSYSFPNKWIKKAHMQGCSIFFHTNNLFVITNYKGPDPETQNFGGLPPSRNLVSGLNFNF